MNPTLYMYMLYFIPLIILLSRRESTKKKMTTHHLQRKKSNKETKIMIEFAKQFIGERCLIYIFDSQMTGIIKEISESSNAILIENGNNAEIINLEYVTRIRKVPVNKKGKKKFGY